jgi:hypothetical protein
MPAALKRARHFPCLYRRTPNLLTQNRVRDGYAAVGPASSSKLSMANCVEPLTANTDKYLPNRKAALLEIETESLLNRHLTR